MFRRQEIHSAFARHGRQFVEVGWAVRLGRIERIEQIVDRLAESGEKPNVLTARRRHPESTQPLRPRVVQLVQYSGADAQVISRAEAVDVLVGFDFERSLVNAVLWCRGKLPDRATTRARTC